MRCLRWAFVGVFALALTGSVHAQGSPQTALTGVKPSDLQFKKVDTGEVMRSANGAMNTAGASGFSLTSFFRRLTGPGNKTLMGSSAIPPPRFSKPVQPQLPVNSTVFMRQ